MVAEGNLTMGLLSDRDLSWRELRPASLADWSRWLASIALPGEIALSTDAAPGALAATRLSAGGRLAHLQLNPQSIEHGPGHLSSVTEPGVLVHVVLEGAGTLVQGDEAWDFQAGDITYRSVTRPSSLVFSVPTRLAVLNLPSRRLSRPGYACHGPDRAQRLSENASLAGLIRQTADCLLGAAQGSPGSHRGALEQSLVLLLASAYQEKCRRPKAEADFANPTRWRQIMLFLEANFAEESLSPESCARQVGISPRYLHWLFAQRGLSFSHTVQALRLDQAQALLRQSLGLDIASIAFQCGFASPAHFSRCFKQRFNLSPRAFRKGAGGI